MAEPYRDRKVRSQPFGPADFFAIDAKPKRRRKQTPDEIRSAFRQIAALSERKSKR